MKRSGLIAAGLLMAGSTVAIANGVGDRVTGGAEYIAAGGVTFSMTANAITTPKGLRGSIQYTRDNGTAALIVHASVECLVISADGTRAVMAGPAMVQENTIGANTNDWFAAAVREDGTGSGDNVRAWFVTAGFSCAGYNLDSSAFPGEVMDGEFKIRPAGT
jgi:hypothetical protein